MFWFTLIYFARIQCTDDIVTFVTEIFAICILFMNVYWDCLLVENMNHHSVLSIVILMLIIVTVSSQDTALYI